MSLECQHKYLHLSYYSNRLYCVECGLMWINNSKTVDKDSKCKHATLYIKSYNDVSCLNCILEFNRHLTYTLKDTMSKFYTHSLDIKTNLDFLSLTAEERQRRSRHWGFKT